MKRKTILLPALAILALVCFISLKPSAKLKVKSGTYGACGCDNSGVNSSKMELTINEDFTFHLFDNTDPGKKIDVKGNWEVKDNVIMLKDYNSDFSIEDKWTIDKNEKCIKSRKGLAFTRLCNLKECN
jgi:hypothetical protein